MPFLSILRLSDQINNWFHTPYSDELAPIDSIDILCDSFFQYVRSKELKLIMSKERIWGSLCEATCTLRKAYLSSAPQHITRKHSYLRPPEWKEEYDVYWNAILEYLFTDEILRSIFRSVPDGIWEKDVRHWRETLSMFLSMYIQPTLEVLEEFGYITRENEQWVTYEEQEEEWETY